MGVDGGGGLVVGGLTVGEFAGDDVVVAVGLLVVAGDVVVDPGPRERYQFVLGSPRHSPTVTPFQSFFWMRSK